MKRIIPLLLLVGCGSPELDQPNPPPNWSLEATPIPKEVPEELAIKEPTPPTGDGTDDDAVDTVPAVDSPPPSPDAPPTLEPGAPAKAPPAVE